MSRSLGATSLTTRSPIRSVAVADLLETGDHPEAGRLAAARGPDEDHELAVGDGEVQVVDREHVAVFLGDVVERHGRHVRTSTPPGHRGSLHPAAIRRRGRTPYEEPARAARIVPPKSGHSAVHTRSAEGRTREVPGNGGRPPPRRRGAAARSDDRARRGAAGGADRAGRTSHAGRVRRAARGHAPRRLVGAAARARVRGSTTRHPAGPGSTSCRCSGGRSTRSSPTGRRSSR